MRLSRRDFHAMVGGLVVGSAMPSASQSGGAWRPLLVGTSLDAWRGFKSDAAPSGWRVADGTLSKDGPVPDLISRDQFGDFELELDWKIGEAGNSGIFYRGTEEYDRIYWSAPEYQLLDDVKGADNKTRLTCAGAAYALYPSPAGHLKPVGEWNQHAHPRPRPARGTLAEWRQAPGVRAVERRLGREGEGQQVQGLAELRQEPARTPRDPRRSRRRAGVPQHPHQVAVRRPQDPKTPGPPGPQAASRPQDLKSQALG